MHGVRHEGAWSVAQQVLTAPLVAPTEAGQVKGFPHVETPGRRPHNITLHLKPHALSGLSKQFLDLRTNRHIAERRTAIKDIIGTARYCSLRSPQPLHPLNTDSPIS